LREPLLHFVLAGTVLFGGFTLLGDNQESYEDVTTIVVDRRNLLNYVQYRANAFEPDTFGAALDAMTDAELQELIDAYIDEEVLYREARELGLETSDNIIRQRMIQKMVFIMSDVAATGQARDPAALEAYFEDNIDAYAVQPWATFTHVFFDASRRGDDGARADAEAALAELNGTGVLFSDAPAHGDRFPFLRNYVERTFEYIASHFGYEFTAALEALQPSDTLWQGPFRSAYGAHLVMVTDREQRRLPQLDEVRGDVEREYANQQTSDILAELRQAIRER
jgi:hypothetical protein